MKTINKIIMAIALMASFVSNSYGQEPKVINVEEKAMPSDRNYGDYGLKRITVSFDDGVKLKFADFKDAPDQVVLCGCEYEKAPLSGRVIIPSQIESKGIKYKVTSIKRAFCKIDGNSCEGLTHVIIPNSVTSIGEGAFWGCTSLTSIIIPNSVTSIGSVAFSECSGLTSITIPNCVTSIGDGAFGNCTSLTSITIPNSVTVIESTAFSGCVCLTSITIPNSVTSIGDYAFDYTGLTSITIPCNVTNIGDGIFSGCSSLAKIVVVDGNKHYDSRDNCNAIVETATNTMIAACPKTRIPNSVTSIGPSAFKGFSKLTSISIPNSVTNIDSLAFAACTGLTSITIPNSVTSINYGAFGGCEGLTSITIPNSVTSIRARVFSDCTGLPSITIPNRVTIIAGGAFERCSKLTSVTIPNSVTTIEPHAFAYCTGLTHITIPNSVTEIHDLAFLKCTNLESVIIQNSTLSSNLNYREVFRGCDKFFQKTNQNTSRTTTFNNEASVVSYLCGHTFKSSDGIKLSFKSYAMYVNGREIPVQYKVTRYDSKTAVVELKESSLTSNSTGYIYVYGFEGHIIDSSDNKMYFAQ